MTSFWLLFVAISSLMALFSSLIFSSLSSTVAVFSLLVAFVTAWKLKGKDEKSSWLSWLLLLFLGSFFTGLFVVESGQIWIGNINNYGDLTFHIHTIRALARGLPFWPENPIYALDKMRYPFGINLFNALWEILGVPLRTHLVAVGLISSFILFRVGRQVLGVFGILALIAGGGWAADSWMSTSDISWKNLFLAVFVTQRGLLFALPCGLYLIFQIMQLRKGKTFFLKDWLRLNILWGALAFFHLHSFFILTLALPLLWIPWRRLFFLIPGFLLGAAFALNSVWGGAAVSSSVRWVPLWTWNAQKSSLWDYVWGNFHLWPWAFAGAALFLLKKQTRIICVLLGLTFLSLQWMLAPWAWDQIKILLWIYIFWLIVLRQAWVRWGIVRWGLIVLLLWPGLQQLWQARKAAPIAILSQESVVESELLVKNILVQDRVLAAPVYNHPLHWTGQALVMGFDGHVWSQGLNTRLILQKMDSIFLAQENWQQAAQDLGAKYLFWGQNEERRYSVLATQIQQLPVVARTSVGVLYALDVKGF